MKVTALAFVAASFSALFCVEASPKDGSTPRKYSNPSSRRPKASNPAINQLNIKEERPNPSSGLPADFHRLRLFVPTRKQMEEANPKRNRKCISKMTKEERQMFVLNETTNFDFSTLYRSTFAGGYRNGEAYTSYRGKFHIKL